MLIRRHCHIYLRFRILTRIQIDRNIRSPSLLTYIKLHLNGRSDGRSVMIGELKRVKRIKKHPRIDLYLKLSRDSQARWLRERSCFCRGKGSCG